MKYAFAPSLSPVASARSASARSAFFFMSFARRVARAPCRTRRALPCSCRAALSISPISDPASARRSSFAATALRQQLERARHRRRSSRCSRPITTSAAQSSGFLSSELAVLLLEQIDRAIAPVHLEQLRERRRVVRVLREDRLVASDHRLVERVALTPQSAGCACATDERRASAAAQRAQDSRGGASCLPDHSRCVRPCASDRRYARIRASIEPRFLRRISMQKSRTMRAWLFAIATKRTPRPDASGRPCGSRSGRTPRSTRSSSGRSISSPTTEPGRRRDHRDRRHVDAGVGEVLREPADRAVMDVGRHHRFERNAVAKSALLHGAPRGGRM